ncbi:hypothetical protein Scep_026016 [Stephania cephalantha]|uniref:MLO-like protein n=1 Tax=Stephania cephalantha TaxID=152367 RepID=A0AAP0EPK5_9MAGN
MAGEGEGLLSHSKELDQTPTWAVAAVVAVIIVVSILLEKVLHHVGEYFVERRKKALFEALEKVKGGFISLLLTFGQNYISRICIPLRIADSMLPCPYRGGDVEPVKDPTHPVEEHHRRRLLSNERRFLSGDDEDPTCQAGYQPLISIHGLHQLHIFIFFLAVFHVVYSAITMMLGRLKIRGWKEWERETSTRISTNDQPRFRLTHETSFVKGHSSFWTKIPFFFYVVILSVGTKLQSIIAQMAIEIQEKHAVIQGIPLVQVTDKHFWFGWPQLVLYLIHFTLFQNAFQITYFLWIAYEFGLTSCFHENLHLIVAKFFLGNFDRLVVQFMCSYITLPLYALVTQMGSTMKQSIFDEETSKAIKKWRMKAKKKNDGPTTKTLGGSPSESPVQLGRGELPSDAEAVELRTREQRHGHGKPETDQDGVFTEVDLLNGP